MIRKYYHLILLHIYFFSVREIQKSTDLSKALVYHFSLNIPSTPLSKIFEARTAQDQVYLFTFLF